MRHLPFSTSPGWVLGGNYADRCPPGIPSTSQGGDEALGYKQQIQGGENVTAHHTRRQDGLSCRPFLTNDRNAQGGCGKHQVVILTVSDGNRLLNPEAE